MSWVDDFNRDAVKVACDYDLEPGDKVTTEAEYDPGFYYSSWTNAPEHMSFDISVRNEAGIYVTGASFSPEEMPGFWNQLMLKGTERNECKCGKND